MIGGLSVLLEAAVLLCTDPVLWMMQIPQDIYSMTREYLQIIFLGILFTFLYNYFASLLRALALPLWSSQPSKGELRRSRARRTA